ncbi:MAG: hypothetical protein JSV65_18860 [Armatimonadota bacterium]|nr:MAG: hypothetical protein JSV65_18860 [Armatimonadota bacterium]
MPRSDTRRRKRFPFALKLALVFLVAASAVLLLLAADLQRARKWRLEKLRAAGIPTSMAEIAPPPVPDEENAAILYDKATKLLELDHADEEQLDQFVRNDPLGSRVRLQAEIKAILARNERALALIKRAAAMPRCRFPTDWTQPPPQIMFPQFGRLRDYARLLAADVLIAIADGDSRRAVESLRAGIGLSRHAASEPVIIGFFASGSMLRIALATLPDLIARADLDPDVCRALFDDLQGVDLYAYFRGALAGEAAQTLWLFDIANRRPGEAREALGFDETDLDPGTRVALGLYFSPLGRPIRSREEINYLETIEAMLALADKPYRRNQKQWTALADKMDGAPSHHVLTRLLVPGIRQTALSRDDRVAFRNAAQVALALEAYHTTHGGYPDSLDALQRYPGWRLPDDPFSGKPFGYERRGDGCVLSSWGEDLDDDGGRPYDPRAYPRDGDLVWEFVK